VGSNAVVVRDVPAGATVVGVPGHVVARKKADEKEAQREEMARRIGFESYGQRRDMPDPIQNALDAMLDHMRLLEQQIAELERRLKARGDEPPHGR
jgi:serine O-acetyltransferase